MSSPQQCVCFCFKTNCVPIEDLKKQFVCEICLTYRHKICFCETAVAVAVSQKPLSGTCLHAGLLQTMVFSLYVFHCSR